MVSSGHVALESPLPGGVPIYYAQELIEVKGNDMTTFGSLNAHSKTPRYLTEVDTLELGLQVSGDISQLLGGGAHENVIDINISQHNLTVTT